MRTIGVRAAPPAPGSLPWNGQPIALFPATHATIFSDGIEGAMDLDIWREVTETEKRLLRTAYPSLTEDRFTAFVHRLSRVHTREMEPQYITR